MPNNTAAVWSAVAASFAALAAFLVMWIQRRTLLESARPELVLTGWTRRAQGQDNAAHEVIAFQTIRNVGRGAALHLHLHLNAAETVGNRPTAVMSTARLPILAPDEPHDINGEIVVWWKNVPDVQGGKYLPITLTILCWDSRSMCHETRYRLFVAEAPYNVGVAYAIAPGVMLTSRTTTTKSVWRLKLSSRTRRILKRANRWSELLKKVRRSR